MKILIISMIKISEKNTLSEKIIFVILYLDLPAPSQFPSLQCEHEFANF